PCRVTPLGLAAMFTNAGSRRMSAPSSIWAMYPDRRRSERKLARWSRKSLDRGTPPAACRQRFGKLLAGNDTVFRKAVGRRRPGTDGRAEERDDREDGHGQSASAATASARDASGGDRAARGAAHLARASERNRARDLRRDAGLRRGVRECRRASVEAGNADRRGRGDPQRPRA